MVKRVHRHYCGGGGLMSISVGRKKCLWVVIVELFKNTFWVVDLTLENEEYKANN